MNAKTNALIDDVRERLREASENRNIASSERLLSVAAGTFVLYTGITGIFRSPFTSLAEVLVGSVLILRGATGYCPVKDAASACCHQVAAERIDPERITTPR